MLAELAKLGHNVGTELPMTEKQFLETELDKSAKYEARRNGQTEPVGKIEIYKHWYQDTSTADGERLIERHADNLLIAWNDCGMTPDCFTLTVRRGCGWRIPSRFKKLIVYCIGMDSRLNSAVLSGKLGLPLNRNASKTLPRARVHEPGGRYGDCFIYPRCTIAHVPKEDAGPGSD